MNASTKSTEVKYTIDTLRELLEEQFVIATPGEHIDTTAFRAASEKKPFIHNQRVHVAYFNSENTVVWIDVKKLT